MCLIKPKSPMKWSFLLRISTADTPKISECSLSPPEKHANAILITPFKTPQGVWTPDHHIWPDYWNTIVLNHRKELKKKKEKPDTARLVKSDLNFHLFFQPLLSLLKNKQQHNKSFLSKTTLSHLCIHLHHFLQKRKHFEQKIFKMGKKSSSSLKQNLRKLRISYRK